MNESRRGQSMRRKERWGAALGLTVLVIAMGWRWLWPSIQAIDWNAEPEAKPDDRRIAALAAQDSTTSAVPEDEPDLPAETVATATAEDLPAESLDAEAEAERDRLLAAAELAMAAKHWLSPEDANALALYTQVLTLDPAMAKARIGREALLDSLFTEAGNALDDSEDTLARDLVAALDQHGLTDRRLPPLARRIQALPGIREQLATAADRIGRGQLLEPDGDSALDAYRAALALDGRNRAALEGLDDLAAGLLNEGLAAASNGDFPTAERLLAEATAIAPGNQRLAEASARIATSKQSRFDDLLARAELALKGRDRVRAAELLADVRLLGVTDPRIDNLATRIENAAIYGSFQPGDQFADSFTDRSGDGPKMVVVPLGEFLMGSPDNEPRRSANEGPQHRVRIVQPFALARTETTVGQFRKFVSDTGYVTDAERLGESSIYDEKTGRITRQSEVTWKNDYLGGRAKSVDPVVHVSWNDARAYAEWLARMTGKRYRLASEAEFEYSLRAGGTSAYWWGDGDPETVVGNLTGEGDRSRVRKRTWTKSFPRYRDGYWGPAPVAQFVANPFGLYDMGGNVSEWVEDCWHDNYLRAPDTGEAWVNRGCTGRTLRGGSWGSSPEDVRSAHRLGISAETRSARIGFRVARDMTP